MTKIEIFDCPQNSPEWYLARRGIPTASSFADVLARGKTAGAESLTRKTYLMKLAGEILTGEPMKMVVTRDMERGHMMEPEARDLYSLQTGASLERVGFVRHGRAGCSPDSLIGTDGGLEIKTTEAHLLIPMILRDEFPPEHKAQVQGSLWVTGRQWWDVAVYWPGLPLFVKRMERDEAYIETLAAEVARFTVDLDAIVTEMRQRIHDQLPDWIALRDLTPSPELLASPIVKDFETLAPNGMPAFLVRPSKSGSTLAVAAE